MTISGKPLPTRHLGPTRGIGLAVLAAYLAGVTYFVMPERVAAQATPGPGPAPSPIAFGQTISGGLTSTDPITRDGRPVDTFRFESQTPNQVYVVSVRSPQIPLQSSLRFRDASVTADPTVRQQLSRVFVAGQQVQYAGRLTTPGTYLIEVHTGDVQRPVGSYTLTLSSTLPAPPPPAGQ